jgi:hypothetical protein
MRIQEVAKGDCSKPAFAEGKDEDRGAYTAAAGTEEFWVAFIQI